MRIRRFASGKGHEGRKGLPSEAGDFVVPDHGSVASIGSPISDSETPVARLCKVPFDNNDLERFPLAVPGAMILRRISEENRCSRMFARKEFERGAVLQIGLRQTNVSQGH